MTRTSTLGQFSAALKTGAAIAVGGMLCGAAAYAQELPRTADGNLDLSGTYTRSPRLPTGEGSGPNFRSRTGNFFGFEEDNGLSRMALRNRPVYKPEY